ncbi:putative roothairless [Hordeum vulgare]|nr:putative roothairless [Hordeum vulgare]
MFRSYPLLLVTGLLAALLPAAAATFGPQPGASCDPTLLATQATLFYAPDMPTTQCCEPVVAAVDLGGGVPCLCRVAAEPNRLLFCILNICKEILSYLPEVVGIDIVELALWAKENTVTLDNQENNKEGQETSVATQTERKVTAKVTVENDLVSQAKDEEEDMETLLDTYVMGIGEADAFSERLKQELVALEAANVYQLVQSEPLIEEEKASYFTNAEKLKVGYTSRTRIRRATTGDGVRSLWNGSVID